jgi:hypothetical protein
MKSWVFTFRVMPPAGTVSARNGSNAFFAYYSPITNRWSMIYPGGEERIDEPQMLFLDSEYVKAHEKDLSMSPRRPTIRLREGKRKAVQFELAF